jgi:hypothetical protein
MLTQMAVQRMGVSVENNNVLHFCWQYCPEEGEGKLVKKCQSITISAIMLAI